MSYSRRPLLVFSLKYYGEKVIYMAPGHILQCLDQYGYGNYTNKSAIILSLALKLFIVSYYIISNNPLTHSLNRLA